MFICTWNQSQSHCCVYHSSSSNHLFHFVESCQLWAQLAQTAACSSHQMYSANNNTKIKQIGLQHQHKSEILKMYASFQFYRNMCQQPQSTCMHNFQILLVLQSNISILNIPCFCCPNNLRSTGQQLKNTALK